MDKIIAAVLALIVGFFNSISFMPHIPVPSLSPVAIVSPSPVPSPIAQTGNSDTVDSQNCQNFLIKALEAKYSVSEINKYLLSKNNIDCYRVLQKAVSKANNSKKGGDSTRNNSSVDEKYSYPSTYESPTSTAEPKVNVYEGAGSYTRIGNTTFGSDGSTYTQIGNSVFGNDGSTYQRIGGTVFGNDGSTYQKIGNTTFGSDGSTYQQIGNTTFGNDGSTFTDIGNTTFYNP